jgi:cytoskeletal protein CcmA (bactofilin family)
MKIFDRDQEQAASGKAAEKARTTDGAGQRKDEVIAELKKASTTPASTPRNAPAPAARKADLSVIGKTVFVKGEVEAAEDMLVEGRVEGSMKHTANQLIIGVSGVVNADIHAKNLVIEGTVDGNIVGSESVVIKESAEVHGNVYTARISIADGAQFSGSVDMDLSKGPKH